LRARRKAIAAIQGVPPYVVFHDATLTEMVEQRPRTLEQLAQVSGVGRRKLDAYGTDFLEMILSHEYQDEEPLSRDSSAEIS
jgi:ATP-dependent DNA helicase RecQ